MKLNGKTLARLAAVQLIYQYQINQEEQSLSLLMSNIQEYYSSTTSDHDFFPYKKKLHCKYFVYLVKCIFANKNV